MSLQLFFVTSAIIILVLFSTARSHTNGYYTAAVFEHARRGNFSIPQEDVETNLAFYRKAAEVAKSKGADIIVFPEYGLFPPGDRASVKNYLENTPDPKVARRNPCTESETFDDKPILHVLSCIAKNNSIVVVANTGSIEKNQQCECPDKDFHFNTNVAFDSDGTLIARYYKERLFFESGMDLPVEPQDPTFNTTFGKFAMFICFDVVFKKIADISKDVDAILLPTMWIDPTPLMASVQFWQSFATANDVTFMAANIQLPGYFAVGSGIFDPFSGHSAYTYNTDGKSKLIVSEVPKPSNFEFRSLNWSITEITINDTRDYENDGDKVPEVCSRKILNETKDPFTDYRCLEEDTSNYTFIKLNQPKGYLEACNNGICCSVDYDAEDMNENYYLGVYNGTYNMFNRYFWWEQNCLLVRCEPFGNNSCATFPRRSSTRFRRVTLSANITCDHIYPSILSSGVRLVDHNDWTYNWTLVGNRNYTINFSGSSELLVVGLNGRCYDKDPPYIR